ncbi:MAG: ATP-dependent metallopeptidase FtsH/Yme1/Tma family protein [Deltaproteobacteria bacterium]|nr:ATP-dependent metallopeptidase FtsH/Yme1/Tma family protein [Deltaproteobacteria bacterium]
MRNGPKTLAIWLLIIVMFAAVYEIIDKNPRHQETPKFSQLLKDIKDGSVKELKVVVHRDGRSGEFEGKLDTDKEFKTSGVVSDDVLRMMQEKVPSYSVEREEQGGLLQSFLITWLPLLVMIGIFVLFMRQLQSGGGKAMSFGKSRAKLMNDSQNKVTFDDVAGVEEAKDDVEEIIEFLRDPKKFTRLGGRIPKGVLLMGPPGTGKTLIARAIAGEAGVPFFSISGSDFVEMFVGVGASRVRDLFEQGKKNAPCIIFIDEIDAVGRHRGAGLGGGHDEREQTLNQLLVEMDGFESNDGVILIAATNRPDVLDPALLRPGRFDRRIIVPRPDVRGRLGILKVHTKRTPLDPNVDLDVIARSTPGFSGADLESLVNEAALLAARRSRDRLAMVDFEEAKDKVLMGGERKSMVISDDEKRKTAYHEAGHTLVARKLPNTDPVHKVTIIPRGRALGLTQQIPADDRYSLDRERVLSDIAVLMGGRAAEEIVFGTFTTGAGNDIERATELARKMICEWGMNAKLGPVTYGKKEEQIFLGREMQVQDGYSEQTAVEIDRELRGIVHGQYDLAMKLLNESRSALESIAQALLEYETLDGSDVERLISGQALDKPKPETKKNSLADEARGKKDERANEPRGGLLGTPQPGSA